MSESRLKQTMRGVSLRVTVRDTCVALLEGGEREADDEEESSEEVDKDKSGGGGSSSVRIESALVVRLERVACHHTSETTKRQSEKECLKSLCFVIFYYYFQVFEKELTILVFPPPHPLPLLRPGGSHQVTGTVVAASGLNCTLRRHLPKRLFVSTAQEPETSGGGGNERAAGSKFGRKGRGGVSPHKKTGR